MAAFGQLGEQRACSRTGRVVGYGPPYRRSISFKEVKVKLPSDPQVSWTSTNEVFEGWFHFSSNDERGCITRRKDHGPFFKGVFLDKVCTEYGCANKFPVSEEFYPVLKRLLHEKMNWGNDFLFKGLADFIPCLMEWTKEILKCHEKVLRQAEIYGLVAISRFPYMYHKDVWRAFCELWSPLTNTLHHGGGEMGISLNDLKQIGGLPILGEPYEEFLPPNEALIDDKKYPPTVLELLRIHAMICKHYDEAKGVSWWRWISHFYRGEQNYIAFGEGSEIHNKKSVKSKPMPPAKKKELLPLHVSKKGALATYFALLLSRFVLLHGLKTVRPETFVMACFMAEGRKISLAPTVLGHIYHGLGEMATHVHPGRANPNFGIHFVIGWLGEYFHSLYRCRPDSDFPEKLPFLARYPGVSANGLKLREAILVFRHSNYVSYQAVSFGDEAEGLDDYNSKDLSDGLFERLICIRSAVLPVRVGTSLILEPYYPNRFARQFGFDQGVPSNGLKFSFSQRSRKSIEDIARSYSRLFNKKNEGLFHIPRACHLGSCSCDYCGWWVAVSTPYLSQSINKINVILTGKETQMREPIFIIADMRSVTVGLKKAVRVSEIASSSSCNDSPHIIIDEPVGSVCPSKRTKEDGSPSDDAHFKRARYNRRDKSIGSNHGDSVDYDGASAIAPVFQDECTGLHGDEVLYSPNIPDCTTLIALPTQLSLQEEPSILDIVPITCASSTLQNLFSAATHDWLRQGIIMGIKTIVEIISGTHSSQDLLATQAQVFEHLEAFKGVISVARLNEMSASWFVARVQDVFDAAASTLKGTIDTNRVQKLSIEFSSCLSDLTVKNSQWSLLCERSLSLKEQEKEVLEMEAKARKKREDFIVARDSFENDKIQLTEAIKLDEDKKQKLQTKLQQADNAQLEEPNSKESFIRQVVADLSSFASSG